MGYDAVVIGSSPAGCEAAAEARRHGLRVLLVDDGGLSAGGTLRHWDLAVHQLREYAHWLVAGPGAGPDPKRASGVPYSSLVRRAALLAGVHSRRLRVQLGRAGVDLVRGPARLLEGGEVELPDGHREKAPIRLIAVASEPRHPADLPIDPELRIDASQLGTLERLPRSLLIVGAEQEGMTLASVFAALGTSVTVIDRRLRMLRYLDRDVMRRFNDCLQANGVEVVLGEWLAAAEEVDEGGEPFVRCQLTSGRLAHWEHVLVALGRRADVSGVDLDPLGLSLDARAWIHTDEWGATPVAGVWAVGSGQILAGLADPAPSAGRRVMRSALGLPPHLGPPEIVSFPSLPELGMVGLNDDMCRKLDVPCDTIIVERSQVLAWQIHNVSVDTLKIVVGRGPRTLIGIHALGEGARELAQFGAEALHQNRTLDDIADSSFPATSVLEGFREAALRGAWSDSEVPH